MEMHNHPLPSLFDQLGLGSTELEINSFITKHAPIFGELENAKFWNVSQSSFLKQAKDEDADWSEIVDQLDALLRKTGK